MRLWNDLKIRSKILSMFGFVILLFLVGIIVVYLQLNSSQQDIEAQNIQSQQAIRVTDMEAIFRTKYILVNEYLQTGEFDEETYRAEDELLESYFSALEGNLNTGHQSELLGTIVQNKMRFDEIVERVFQRSVHSDSEIDVLNGIMLDAIVHIEELSDEMIAESERSGDQAVASIYNVQLLFLIIFVAATLLGIILFVAITQSLSHSLNKVVSQANEVSTGNLSAASLNINRKDEIGQLTKAMNQMTDNLQSLVGGISDISTELASSAEELQAGSEETSRATEQITSAIQEVATGAEEQMTGTRNARQMVGEMSSAMEQIASSAQITNDSVKTSSDQAQNGIHVIDQTISQMDTIREHTNKTHNMVDQLGVKSEKIEGIVSLITNITDQTNLLALNAAIEAARAGESGKGFAVVADEVRKLAEQSRQSAGQIETVIHEIREDIQQSVESMSLGDKAVEEGVSLVNQAGNAFTDITNVVKDISAQMEEISAGIEESTATALSIVSTVDSITGGAESVADNTQTVAASAEEQHASMEEVASSSGNLARLSEDLQEKIGTFKL